MTAKNNESIRKCAWKYRESKTEEDRKKLTGKEVTRQLLLHNICCGQMVLNNLLGLLHCPPRFAHE